LSAKVPERAKAPKRLYTIPPSAPFLSTLARAVLSGNLPLPGGARPDPLVLPHTTIYLPTRRAARALREAFLAEAGSNALLLPRIRALADEDAAIILGAADAEGDDGEAGAPAISPLARRLALMRLVMAFRHGSAPDASETALDAVRWEITPGQASALAADLARLMDTVETEEVDLATLGTIVPDDLAAHWESTVEFLKIVTEHWPRFLADNALVSPVARRNALMAREAERLAAGSAHPVIAAGSTGTVPATARLLEVIASLPNGAVVLPGLDLALDEESWASLPEHPEHPQAGMAALLRKLDTPRAEVAYVPGSAPAPAASARLRLVSEALRPAETTERWQHLIAPASADPAPDLAAAFAGINLVVAPTAHDEAEAIALILRSCIEQPGKTAALVTPDRVLARRVAARLKRYGLAIDDSAGVPVARTLPGAFLDLVLNAVAENFAPPALMALLKHPLTLLGRRPWEIRRAARALERGAFRDVYVGEGLGGARSAIEAPPIEPSRRRHTLKPYERDAVFSLIADLEAAFAPLTAWFAEDAAHSAAELAEAHAAVAEALARDPSGASAHLWSGDAGEALTVTLTELIAAGVNLDLPAKDYPSFYRSLLSGKAVRPRTAAHPRLFIWGPLEARLQQPDLVILGSLNEGVWPRPQEAGPWLSRKLRARIGLAPPERFTGLSAHDFAQSLGASTVYLSRAEKVDGVPSVPSRWLQRLQALARATGLEAALQPAQPYVPWARERDRVPAFTPISPPSPRPPSDARPRRLSVTRIERWIANPYEIFARDILKLEPLKPLGAEPDAALRGSIVHRVLHEFAAAYPNALPADIEGELIALAERQFAELGGAPSVEAFWRPQFSRFASWFAATEPARRASATSIYTEVKGALQLPGQDFTLTARADRIDIGEDGTATIYDYKTGKAPIPKHVADLFAPQLPLEAAIAEQGGFAHLGRLLVADLRYIEASGRDEGGEERAACNSAASTLAAKALEDLARLVARYADPDMPYEVKRRKAAAFARVYDYDAYEHLARAKEWLTQELDEEWR
jgi:double-strand break repair protein AddB